MLNIIMLVGRLGKAPEMSYSANGTPVTKFSIATDDGWGENKTTTWHNIVTFQKTAEACAQYLDKGSLVAVVGRQSHRKYDDKAGQTKYFAEVVAERVQFLDSKGESGGGNAARGGFNPGAPVGADADGDITPDDLPF